MTASCTFVLLNPPKDSCADTVLVEGRQGPIPKQVLVIKSGPDAPAFSICQVLAKTLRLTFAKFADPHIVKQGGARVEGALEFE